MLPNRWPKKALKYIRVFCKHGKTVYCLFLVLAITIFAWIYSSPFATTKEPFETPSKIQYFMTNTIIQPSPDICRNNPRVILLVDSHVYKGDKRDVLRKLLPNEVWTSAEFVRIFMIGQIPDASQQTRIELESHQHGDILQGSFEDHYKNSTYKTLMGLHWVTKACRTASYIIKMSRTTELSETFLFLRHLDALNKYTLLVGNRIIKAVPVRNPEKADHPAYTSWEEYGGLFFPPYLSGGLYVTTPQVAERLVDEAPNHKYLFLEDVFVTGILTQALHIHVKDFSQITEQNESEI